MGTKGKFKGFEKNGKIIANIQKAIFGGSKRARFLSKLANGGYGRKYFPEDNSSFAWMTSDKEEIKKLKKMNIFQKFLRAWKLIFKYLIYLKKFQTQIIILI